ncbi:MAG: hypothetical protein R3B07_13450 [Polyangiaceae bacterium]
MRSIRWLLASLVILGGCSTVPQTAKSAISATTQCPEDQLEFRREGSFISGRGCGQFDQAVHMCSAVDEDECTWRSVHQLKTERLRRRASADFQCDAAQLAIAPLDQKAWNVRGCNQAGTYLWSCAPQASSRRDWNGNFKVSSQVPPYADDCTWILNNVRN